MYFPQQDEGFDYPGFTSMALDLAPQLDMEIRLVDPRHGYLLEVNWQGRTRHILADVNPFNGHTASRIARDKVYTYMILAKEGFSIPLGDYFFFSDRFRRQNYERNKGKKEALQYAEKLGYPILAKPNTSSMGKNVAKLFAPQELMEHIEFMEETSPREYLFHIQEFLPGREFRVYFLDDDPFLIIEKEPFTICGDGRQTIGQLVQNQWEERNLRTDPRDYETLCMRLELRGQSAQDILEDGYKLVVEDAAYNLHRGATAREVDLPQAIIDECRRSMEVLGLRYGGVDFKLLNDRPVLLEINSNAGMFRFAKTGDKEATRVRKIYRSLLQRLFSE